MFYSRQNPVVLRVYFPSNCTAAASNCPEVTSRGTVIVDDGDSLDGGAYTLVEFAARLDMTSGGARGRLTSSALKKGFAGRYPGVDSVRLYGVVGVVSRVSLGGKAVNHTQQGNFVSVEKLGLPDVNHDFVMEWY